MITWRASGPWLAAGVIALGLLAGCSSGPEPGSRPPVISARLDEFTVTLNPVEAVAGDVVVDVVNEGTIAHDLALAGTDRATKSLPPGSSAQLELPVLGAGTYSLYCSLPGHEAAGMIAELTVTGERDDAVGDPVTDTAPAVSSDTYTAMVDNPGPGRFPATYNAFFPDSLSVPAGATIEFAMPWYSGEPHNVAVGTAVDGAVQAYRAVPPGEVVIPGLPPPGLSPELAAKAAALPAALPPNMESTEVAMAKLAPCYLPSGDPPKDAPCASDQQGPAEAFDGTQSYISSNSFIADGDTFGLQLADDIAPGTYHFICTLHPTSMSGDLTVVGDSSDSQTPQEVRDAGAFQVAELDEAYTPTADRLARQRGPTVDAGALGGGIVPSETVNVLPDEIDVSVGETVTWDMFGAHMLTFNPPEEMTIFRTLERGRDGLARPTAADLEAPGPGQPGMPPGFPTEPVVVDGGSFDGRAYLHSGLLYGRLGPLPPTTYELRFDEPGQFTYYCMRHPGMAGTVVVR